MWKHRRLELQNLCDLGRWLMEDSHARKSLAEFFRRDAFDACNSPKEWDEFVLEHRDDPLLPILLHQYEAIDLHNQKQPRSALRKPVVIPHFDWL